MGFFHCRPISPKDDFTLTSPINIDDVGVYRTNTETSGWYFCRKCGVHVFGVAGVWQQSVPLVEGSEWDENGEKKVVRPVFRTMPTTRTKMVDGKETTEPYHYVSVNAVTLEPSEDIDLKKWHENGWVFYVDSKDHKGPPRPGKPHEGGMY
jgi:hypothetical protein